MNIKNTTPFVVRNDNVNQYLKEINHIYPYTAQEEKDMFVKYHESNDENEKLKIRNDIIMHNQRFVFAVAKRYNQNEMVCDLVNIGNLGMIECFDRFEWERGYRFYSYASYFVQRAINAYFAKDNLMVRPTKNSLLAPKINKIKNRFFLENGREPSTVEIINILKDDYQIDVIDPADVCGSKIEYIDALVSEDADSTTFENLAEWNVATASINDYEIDIDNDNLSYAMSEALKVLNEKERTIVMMSSGVGYDREYKDKEIGDKLGYTSERIRQLRHIAEEKMKSVYLANA